MHPDRMPSSPLVEMAAGGQPPAVIETGSFAGCPYYPSPLERLWTDEPAVGRICEIAASDEHIKASREWLEYVENDFMKTPRGS